MESVWKGKLKQRFFHPLVLLEKLSQTQGDRIEEEFAIESQSPFKDRIETRRYVLRQLCQACDYKKGGETVTAMVLEKTPQGPVYWVALREPLPRGKESVKDPKTVSEKTTEFLQATLSTLCVPRGSTASLQEVLLQRFIEFAAPRIHKHRQLLSQQLNKAKRILDPYIRHHPEHSGVRKWIVELLDVTENKEPTELCQMLYSKFKEGEIKKPLLQLEKLQSAHGVNEQILIRHYMGRLASPVRASGILARASRDYPELFEDYRMKIIGCGQQEIGPSINRGMRPEQLAKQIVGKMFAEDSPGKDELIRNLCSLETTMGLMTKFRNQYLDKNFKLRVHAELALLEAVYAADVEFYDDDRYVACSKGACFCCYHYICHHPGRFVKPASHNKIWLNWAPPVLTETSRGISMEQQRSLLIKVNQEVRQAAISEVRCRSGSKRWHPDSTTGQTRSIAEFGAPDLGKTLVLNDTDRSRWVSDRISGEETPSVTSYKSDSEDGGVKIDLLSSQMNKSHLGNA